MEPWEAEEEEHYLRLYAEHRDQALEEFRAERLSAYFLSVPDAAAAPVAFLDHAERIRPHSNEAALVLAAAANEVAIKTLLLRPLISGLVHAEAVAPLFADELLKPTGFERSKDLLFDLLNRVGEIDLATYRRDGATRSLWEELKDVASKRNAVVHRCAAASAPDVELALSLSRELLLVLYPQLVEKLGLHLHQRVRVCAEYHLPPDLEHLLAGA